MSYTALYPKYCCSEPRCPRSKACCPPSPKKDCCQDKCSDKHEDKHEGKSCDHKHEEKSCPRPIALDCGCGFYGLVAASEDPQFDCLKECENIVRCYESRCCGPADGCGRVSSRVRPRIPSLDERPLRIANCTDCDLCIAITSSFDGLPESIPKKRFRLCKCSSQLLYVNAPGCMCQQYLWIFKGDCLLRRPYPIRNEINDITINGTESCISLSAFHIAC